MKLDYDKLKPGMILGVTSMSPFAITTRITTAGMHNAFNLKIATHIAIVCQEHGLYYIMEMATPKIRERDINEYDSGCLWSNRIVFAAYPFQPWDIVSQKDANDFLLESHRIGVQYNIEELFEFWGIDLPEDHSKIICSDLARNMMRVLKLPYPIEWDKKVSPWDIQKFFIKSNELIDITG